MLTPRTWYKQLACNTQKKMRVGANSGRVEYYECHKNYTNLYQGSHNIGAAGKEIGGIILTRLIGSWPRAKNHNTDTNWRTIGPDFL